MASIFTYEPDPPRVASPWLHGVTIRTTQSQDSEEQRTLDHEDVEPISLNVARLPSQKVTRLKAEPQDGPVEYKLHLLLRPRRKFRATSTGTHISGSRHSHLGVAVSSRSASESAIESETTSESATPPPSSTRQTRQHRLEQLTTQLLWRLQQSSPHHSSSANNIILPSLPEALPELQAPRQPAKLLHGLEESQGALYEIGVSDDGTLIGLAEDEMLESLNNLRAMAACLGCTVEVLRNEVVGECEWLEDMKVGRKERKVRRTGKLHVAEALVKPCLQARSPPLAGRPLSRNGNSATISTPFPELPPPATEQLRVTLAGPTMSGKSTLLGTLTTSTLDNGRGKSRLSMLKHRHEITSGVTSSITQELLGYKDNSNGGVEVINYATENVASWIDIHVASARSRLVFISDSAGHPRYRRTTIKGLVGWAPHWTLLCVPADDMEDTGGKTGSTFASQQSLGAAVSEMDLSRAQLDLCLRLGLPLVIVITKLDLASRHGLKDSLTKVLNVLKAAERKPLIIKNSANQVAEVELQNISGSLIEEAYKACVPMLNDPVQTVPIVLTSSVQGTGIGSLHALLHELPIPECPVQGEDSESIVFHVEDVYSKPAEVDSVIVSGHLRVTSGEISVGDHVVLGPFSVHDQQEDSEDSDERPLRRTASHLPASRSFPGAFRDSHIRPQYFGWANQEWRQVSVSSIRNLRLPVHSLLPGQVGTIAIAPDDNSNSSLALARIRKGMVLASVQPQSTRTVVAEFRREDLGCLAVGNHVVVHIASVRTSAKVVSAMAPDSPDSPHHNSKRQSTGQDPFDFDDMVDNLEAAPVAVAGAVTAAHLLVTFTFDQSKEFVTVGDPVLVIPGGGHGSYGGHERGERGVAGLEGFVGIVKQTLA